MINREQHTSSMRGFTLVETLVAVAILVIAMAGPFYAVQQSLTASYTARDNLIASSLAQDGIEFIRSVRDDNYLYTLHTGDTTRSWLYGLDGTNGSNNCKNNTYCVVDTYDNTIGMCGSPTTCSSLNMVTTANPTNPYFYTQRTSGSALTPTMFTRSVNIQMVNAREAQVTVTVTWTAHRKVNTVTVVDYLDNWL